MEKMVEAIKQDISRQEKANEYFTHALIHLEENRVQEAQIVANRCYAISDSIEQRLAIRMLIQIAQINSHQERMSIIDDIYSYSQQVGGMQNDN
ncbi:hypothetical protein [Alkalihalobacterium chitinilyticum]|uniref:Uncharacterized protein n=1 Tax=Alkalihalobacterium chitinilyticum TaxID=2980103 RepID=A0ABT5VL63_9BACI|nr:hypothetical protein [Alkalihalobacterium chitinilyticum]MDE5415497.1 hypothetical protein [Alkalihalobacterium chitinilyticum]